MATDRSYSLGYAKGYYAGRRKAWPAHQPPEPPNEVVATLMAATTKLRNVVDAFLATVGPDDEMEEMLGPGIDAVDEAMRRVTEWLVGEPGESAPADSASPAAARPPRP
jgi:hypothetical protein